MKIALPSSLHLITIALFLLTACAKATPTAAPIPHSNTLAPSTDIPAAQPTESIIPTSTLGIGSTMVNERDGATLVYVPDGEFTMGANYEPSDLYGSPSFSDNRPQHLVTLDAFWIDQTEVTNKQYALCVTDKACIPPLNLKSPTRSSYYNDPQFVNYPVIHVEWAMAKNYCEWAGRRLPTEAEWEKAARTEQGFIYPWGNDAPNDNLLNYNSTVRDTTEVGNYPDGKSMYGTYDMAGNVWEWTNDWYGENYYPNSSSSNPLGPDLGDFGGRTLRGGSWYFEESSPRSIFRFGVIPVDVLVRSDLRSWLVPVYADTSIYGKPPLGLGTVGLRCAQSVP